MFFRIRLKTGFFETKPYRLIIGNGEVVLSPEEPEGRSITIPDGEILSIGMDNHKAPEIEIHTRDKRYCCTLNAKTDFEKIISSIKENPSVKIVYEYEGGEAHA